MLMSDLFMLSKAQIRRIEPYFPLSHGVPRVDDRRILSGIVFVIRNGLRWRDAPAAYGPHKTIYNRFIRWSRMGVFNKIFAALDVYQAAVLKQLIRLSHCKGVGTLICRESAHGREHLTLFVITIKNGSRNHVT